MDMLPLFLIFWLNLVVIRAKPFELHNYDVHYKNSQDKEGNYHFEHRERNTMDARNETGTIGKLPSGEQVLRIRGDYMFEPTCNSGVYVNYTADEHGYQVKTRYANAIVVEFGPDGKIIGISAACAPFHEPPINSKCLGSLLGSCSG